MINEALRAISARISVALDDIESGNIASGIAVLKGLLKVLPEPEKHNIDAAVTKCEGEAA